MDNLEIGQSLLNVSRVSLLKCVLLITMLISGVVIKMFYLGRGWGREGVVQKLLPDQRTTPSSSLKATRGKQKEKAGGGANKQRR